MTKLHERRSLHNPQKVYKRCIFRITKKQGEEEVVSKFLWFRPAKSPWI